MKTLLRIPWHSWFLGVACLALCVQVVALSLQNRALKATLAAPPTHTDDLRFHKGEPFFPFTYQHLNGQAEEVRFDEGSEKTLLFVFAEACPVCPQILPRWEEIAPHFRMSGVRVLGVLLDEPETQGSEWFDDAPLGRFSDMTRVPLAKLRTVPLTVLVNEAGTVEWVHYGTLTDLRMAELVSLLP